MGDVHQMRLSGRLASGEDEWSCRRCGRRIALRRLPYPELTVLAPGDESAVHIGVLEPDAAAEAAQRYGVGPVQQIPRPSQPPTPDAADHRWLAEIGITW